MTRAVISTLALAFILAAAACANQGTTGPRGQVPNQPEPGSPAAQMH